MSEKMGKNLQHQESEITLKNHSPGCMWGILHHFHHNRWHSVKKRLPRKTHSPAKHSTTTTTDQESTGRTSETAAEVQQNIDSSFLDNSAVETKSADIPPRTTHKSSMKSRIRALITEEMSRRKGRHRRSSSYPIRTQPQRPTPIHHSPVDNDNNKTNNSSNPTGDLFDSVHSTASVGQGSSNTNNNNNNRSCELCATMLNVKYLKQNEVNNKEVKQPIRDHTLVHDKLIYAIEPSKHDSLQESKLFMDALDLLNMRKEVFLKILQDPSSSLAHQLHFRRTNNSKIGLTKSVSFPVSGSSTKRDSNKSENANCTKEEDELQSCIEMTEESNKHYAALRLAKNSNPEQFLREMELSENASSSPPPPTSDKNSRKRHDNKVVLKRFKNLREKLKHVIRDRKKEKNRIIMDAVHHKIPYGRNEDGNSQLPGNSSDYGKTPIQSFKRTSSFNESLDRYNRLLEISLNKGKDENSERLRFRTADNNLSPIPTRPASLARILSLPDLRSYSSLQIDDSTCYHTPDLIHVENTNMGNYSSLIEQKPHSFSESASQENLLDETVDDSTDSKTWESASSHDLNIEPMPVDLQTSKSDHVSENDQFNYHEDDDIICQGHDMSELEDSKQDVDTAESQMKQFYNDIFHVETRNKADFNYVKDILELSGFSRDEILGKWHSAEHPVDPLLFDEIEGCLVTQPDYEEGDGMSSDHLLLFDLINEVLLDIYERSFCYWPMPLTSRSRVHRMPKGYRVLEEVWAEIRRLMSMRAEIDQAIDDAVSRDLDRRDGWMNLQLDGECVGLELEDLIFDDLLDEVVWT